MKLKEVPWLQTPAKFTSDIVTCSDSLIKKIKAKERKCHTNKSSVTTTDPIKKECTEYITIDDDDDDAAMNQYLEKERKEIDGVINNFDYYPRPVAATSSPEAVKKAIKKEK